jgi:hypothetical protein
MVDQISHISGPSLSTGSVPLPSVGARPPSGGGTTATGALPVASAHGITEAAVAQVNQHFQQTQSDFKLQVDPGSDRTVFQVIQKGTGQVLLQIPSPEVLGMSRRMREAEAKIRDAGTLVDKQG